MNQRLIAAALLSLGSHALLGVLLGATIPVDIGYPHLALPSLHVRLMAVDERDPTLGAERADAPAIVPTKVYEGAEGAHRRPVGSGSTFTGAIGESRGSAADAPASKLFPAALAEEDELDVEPVEIDPVVPVYPPEVGTASAGGLVKVRLHIDEVGQVIAVDVLETALPLVFIASATRAFEGVRFRPGLRNGAAVRCRLTRSIQFAPTMVALQPDTPVSRRE